MKSTRELAIAHQVSEATMAHDEHATSDFEDTIVSNSTKRQKTSTVQSSRPPTASRGPDSVVFAKGKAGKIWQTQHNHPIGSPAWLREVFDRNEVWEAVQRHKAIVSKRIKAVIITDVPSKEALEACAPESKSKRKIPIKTRPQVHPAEDAYDGSSVEDVNPIKLNIPVQHDRLDFFAPQKTLRNSVQQTRKEMESVVISANQNSNRADETESGNMQGGYYAAPDANDETFFRVETQSGSY